MPRYNKRTRSVLVTMSSVVLLSALLNNREVQAETDTNNQQLVSQPTEISVAENHSLTVDAIYDDSHIIRGNTTYPNETIHVLVDNTVIYKGPIDSEGRFSIEIDPFPIETVLTIQVVPSRPQEILDEEIMEEVESERTVAVEEADIVESNTYLEEEFITVISEEKTEVDLEQAEDTIDVGLEESDENGQTETSSEEIEEIEEINDIPLENTVIEESLEPVQDESKEIGESMEFTQQPAMRTFATTAVVAKTPFGTEYHYVRSGENLKIIAQEYGVSVEQLALWNNITNVNVISVGQILSVNGYDNYKNIDKETRKFTTTEELVTFLAPGAQKAAKENNIYASVIIAQAIHESGHGKSALAVAGNNLFGIKGSYNGNTINMLTWEDDGKGNAYWLVQPFRLYPSYEESLLDNADKIRNGVTWDPSYYKGAWVENTASHMDATEWLTGRYATDTKYNLKVNDTIAYYGLTKYDTHVKITNPILTQQNIKRTGIITRSGYTIFEQPKGAANDTIRYNTNSFINQEVQINKEKVNNLGTWWHISVNGKDLGYVLKEAISETYSMYDVVSTNHGATIKEDWSINTLPYGVKGYKKITTGKTYYNKGLTVVREAKTDKATYGLISLNGKEIGWIDTGALDELRVLSTKKVDYNAYIAEPWSINTKPWGTRGYAPVLNQQNYLNSSVKIVEEKTTQRGKYGLIQIDGKNIGWIDVGALKIGEKITSSVNVNYAADLKVSTPIYSKPVGVLGSTKVGDTKSYLNKTVTADLEQKTSSNTFVRISLNGVQLGFVKKSDLLIHTVTQNKTVNYDAKITKDWSINTQPWGISGYTQVDPGKKYLGKNVKVTSEKVTPRSTYAHIEIEGKAIGWIDKGAISLYNNVVSTKNTKYVAKVSQPWSINSQPWGTLGSIQKYNAKAYIGKNVEVVQEKITEKSTYALIKLDEKELGWIDVTGIEKISVSSSKPVNYQAEIKHAWSINTLPWGTEGYILVDDGSSYLGKTLKVVEEKTTQRSTYALLQENGIKLGWIDIGAITRLYNITSTTNVSYYAEVTNPWSINSAPWGTANAKQVTKGQNYVGKIVEVIQEKTTDKSTYALIVENGKQIGWIDKTGISPLRVTFERDIHYVGTITKPWSINSKPWGLDGAVVIDNKGTYVGQDFEIKKEVMTQKAIYAQLHIGGKELGWIDTTGISSYVVLGSRTVNYSAKIIKPWSINTQPWGTLQYESVANPTSYLGKTVKVVQEKTTRKATYGLIQLDGKNIGWIDIGALK